MAYQDTGHCLCSGNSQRRVVNNPLKQDASGKYHMDFEDLERKIVKEKVELLLLCNPHNPVGRVWSREELERLGDICCRYQVIVVSDEIHADFVWKGRHHVFADLKEEWYRAMLSYVRENIRFVQEYLQNNIPDIRLVEPEGTYLLWMDFRALGLDNTELEKLIVRKAGLWLDGGVMFGEGGEGFERINVACPRRILEQALMQLKTAIQENK